MSAPARPTSETPRPLLPPDPFERLIIVPSWEEEEDDEEEKEEEDDEVDKLIFKPVDVPVPLLWKSPLG